MFLDDRFDWVEHVLGIRHSCTVRLFDDNSLGKWICDWTVSFYGPDRVETTISFGFALSDVNLPSGGLLQYLRL